MSIQSDSNLSCRKLNGIHLKEWPPGNEWSRNADNKGKVWEEKICAERQFGQGGFAKVYIGHRCITREGNVHCTNEKYAIKVLDCSKLNGTSSVSTNNSTKKLDRSRIKLEIDVHKQLSRNVNVVTATKIFKWPEKNPTEALLCTEFCPLGDVDSYFKKREFTEEVAKDLTLSVVRGLLELKKKGYFHRDIKASNVLVDGQEGHPPIGFKLSDFGLVAKISDKNVEVCGTPSAMAPEMDGKNCYDEKVDVWSLGVLLYTKLLNRKLFSYDQSAKPEKRIIVQRQGWSFPSDVYLSENVQYLIKRMLTFDPHKRITLEEIEKELLHGQASRIDSGFMTSSQISALTTSTTHFRMYQKEPLLPAVRENSVISRPQAPKTAQQPLKPTFSVPIPSTISSIAPPYQASPMPSTCHSKTVATLHHPPLSTLRLRPSTKVHQFSNGCAKIQPDGSVHMEFRKTKEVFQNGRRTKLDDGNETFIVSKNGLQIEVFRKESNRTFGYEDLPSKYWSKYNYAAKFVSIAREQTPKITYYSDKAVCRLMENSPEPNFEMTFYATGVKFSYHSVKGIRIHGGQSKVEQYSAQTLSLDPRHPLANDWKAFLAERERLIRLEKMLEQFSDQHGGSVFPQTIGKRPSSLSS